MAKKGKGLPRKYRQARAAARPAAKAAFPGKKKAFRKDTTFKVTAEDREIYRDIAKESRKGYITDDKGNKIRVGQAESPQERMARDRREARAEVERKLALEDKESRASKSAANMEKTRKEAIAKQEADRAARRGRATPTLQQTPANERPLSRPVKKAAAVKKSSVEKAAAQGKEAAAKTKPQIKKAVAQAKETKFMQAKNKALANAAKANTQNKLKAEYGSKKMTRAEKSAANKAAWAKMSPAERKNWNANKPAASKIPAGAKPVATATMKDGKLTFKLNKDAAKPVYNVTTAQPEKASKGAKKAKFVQKNTAVKAAALKPESGKALAVRPKNAVSTVAKEGAKKAGKAGLLKGAARLAGKAITGRVGLAVGAASLLGEPVLRALVKQPAGARKLGTQKPLNESATKSRSNQPRITGQGRFINAGGSTYTVKKGDTLSGIAKANKTTLAAIREANPKFMKNKKYKQGSMIYSGTKVRIPKKQVNKCQ